MGAPAIIEEPLVVDGPAYRPPPTLARVLARVDLREPIRENLGPGERLLYVGRLAPVALAPRGLDAPIDPSLAAALAALPDRRSKARR